MALSPRPPLFRVSLQHCRAIMRGLNPTIVSPSIEHIVPQSFYRRDGQMQRDMHNLIVVPSRLNTHRSTFRYVNHTGTEPGWEDLDSLGYLCNSSFPAAFKNRRLGLFVPPVTWRGPIARKVCYFLTTYPKWTPVVLRDVLCVGLIREWNERHPVTPDERREEEVISVIQNNPNWFVRNSSLVDELSAGIVCPKPTCDCLRRPGRDVQNIPSGSDSSDPDTS